MKEQQFLFSSAERIVREFGPQLTLDDQSRAILQDDRRFCEAAKQILESAMLLAAADAALYRAKRAGKDRVATATISTPKPSAQAASLGR